MKLDAQLGSYALTEITAAAERLERIGYDCLWSVEALGDPFLPLALAAQATSRTHIGTNVAVAFARSPFLTALIAWDLQKLSAGRLYLGLGTSSRPQLEQRFSTDYTRPAGRIVDYIRCVRAVWDWFQNDTTPAYDGEFYRFTLNSRNYNPGPIAHPRIPIYVAGVTSTMCRAAGAVADGFNVSPFHTVDYLRNVMRPNIEAGATAHDRAITALDISVPFFPVIGESQPEIDAARAFVRRMAAKYAAMPPYRAMLEYHGFDGLHEALVDATSRGDEEGALALVPDTLVELVSVCGSLERLPALLRERYRGVATRVSLVMPAPGSIADSAWTAFAGSLHAEQHVPLAP